MQNVLRIAIGCVLGLAFEPGLAAQTVINASADTWIRPAFPEETAEADLVSIWSSASGGVRYGLVEFDVSALAGQPLAAANLRLYRYPGYSQLGKPIRQRAFIIDAAPGELATLNWATYTATKDAAKVPFESLGRMEMGSGSGGVYLDGPAASPADLLLLEAEANGDGRLSVVFIADEDGTDYRVDWGDNGFVTYPIQLVVGVDTCGIVDSLPAAAVGSPYTTQLARMGCGEGAEVRVDECALPPGLTLDPQTGTISGLPNVAGPYPLSLSIVDGGGGVLESTERLLTVTSQTQGRADFDYDGDVDLEDFHVLALASGGSSPTNAACTLPPLSQTTAQVAAVEDTWIRESHPGTIYEDDYVSVWSQPGDLRYGLVTFDLSGLAGRGAVGAVRLKLSPFDAGSQTGYSMKQTAAIVSGRAAGATWDSFQANQAGSLVPLEGLAHDVLAGESHNLYVASTPASAADRTLIQSVIDAGGALTLVLQPLADGIEYRKDWHDITHGTPPVLEIFFGSPCYPTTLVLPEARAGEPYSASLSASSECLAGLQWSLAGCTLPEGLTLSPAGIISGTPSWAGTWTFRVRCDDGRGPHESDLSLTVGASKADLDGDGDVDAGDFAVFQADVTGPGTGNIDLCWRTYVRKCLDTLIEHGTDRYGSVSTPMLMAVIDVNSLTAPENPPLYDDYVRTEGRPSHGRWSPGGSNLWLDQPLIRTMYRFSEVSGDPKYAAAADAYVNAYLTRARKPNGMMYWGSHSYYHGYSDGPAGDGLHEILILHPEWQRMHQLQPEIIKGLIDGIWDWHIVNHQTGQHNRHDDASYGCDFAFSGGSFIMAFAYMAAATGDPAYMDKAKLVAEWHWSHRHPVTGLIPDSPGVTSRYDSQYSFTCDSGPYAAQLLSSSELTGDPTFRDQAIAIIKAYDHYAYDAAAVNYWAMLGLDGTPFPAQPKGGGYDIWIPSGHVDVWRTIMFSYEFAVEAAEASLYAWEQSGPTVAARDPELLAIARRWGEVLRRNMAPSLGRRWKAEVEEAMPAVKQTGGTYAENYGRAISFYVNLYHATGDQRDLRLAKRLAREAIEKLYANGLFKGHPAKPHYQSNDGVGFLLHALMQLDALPGAWRLAF